MWIVIVGDDEFFFPVNIQMLKELRLLTPEKVNDVDLCLSVYCELLRSITESNQLHKYDTIPRQYIIQSKQLISPPSGGEIRLYLSHFVKKR